MFFVLGVGTEAKERSGPAPRLMQALERLYSSTDGPHWNLLKKTSADDDIIDYIPGKEWNFSLAEGAYLSDPCRDSWYGVVCVSSIVMILQLGDSGLSGVIPSELGLMQGCSTLICRATASWGLSRLSWGG